MFLRVKRCILSKFYIKPQLDKQLAEWSERCILSKFYIKPQRRRIQQFADLSCILSKFYIKPQRLIMPLSREVSCILSKFYIKPQRHVGQVLPVVVVSYRNSTSNHNYMGCPDQTAKLYLIEILHQTTTCATGRRSRRQLYLIEILHQTTTSTIRYDTSSCCILSKFYIKPQRRASY